MYSTDGDCETCKHLNNHRYCENCSSNPDYEDLEDLYEPVSKEEMERIEKRDIEIRINQLQTETLEVSISEELLKSFEIAKGFTEKKCERPLFYSVYFDEDCVVATDSMRMIVIKTDIPDQLQGQMVVSMDDNTAKVLKTAQPFPDYKSVIPTKGTDLRLTKAEFFGLEIPYTNTEEIIKDKEELQRFNLGKTQLTFRKRFIQQALEVFPDDKTLLFRYINKISPLVIEFGKSMLLQLPVRCND